jgi:hypothetical protein
MNLNIEGDVIVPLKRIRIINITDVPVARTLMPNQRIKPIEPPAKKPKKPLLNKTGKHAKKRIHQKEMRFSKGRGRLKILKSHQLMILISQ